MHSPAQRRHDLTMPLSYWRALCLFGLSGTEMSCFMVIAYHTIAYEVGEKAVAIGAAEFSAWTGRTKPGCYHALSNLERYNIVRRSIGDSYNDSYGYLILEPKKWRWELAKCKEPPPVELLDPMVEARPADDPISPEAQSCANMLREHCLAGNPAADVPEASLSDEGFAQWCNYFQRILQRGNAHQLVLETIRWIHAGKSGSAQFWASRCQGRKAAAIYARNFDQILAQSKAAKGRRRR